MCSDYVRVNFVAIYKGMTTFLGTSVLLVTEMIHENVYSFPNPLKLELRVGSTELSCEAETNFHFLLKEAI